MIQSITKTVQRTGGVVKILYDRDMIINVQSAYDLASYVGDVPNGPYEVTWKLDPDGPFIVSKGTCYVMVKRKKRRQVYGTDYDMKCFVICFMPPEWSGQTVSRTVSPV